MAQEKLQKTQIAGCSTLEGKRFGGKMEGRGGMEHNTRKTLPVRSLRDYWEFIIK
jgi:hypothetical protein